jgi:hypothetical protein
MIDFSIHLSDYNREPGFVLTAQSMIMKRNELRTGVWLSLAAGVGLLLASQPRAEVFAQAVATETPASGANQAYITNTFEGEPAINVRTGPSTIIYPLPCGSLAFGASALAIGVSPGHDWIEIEYPACPRGVGWIYAANVTLTGTLQVVEPPPTPTPLATATIDPTLEAAFQVEPTATRLPTFTPPPPLVVPTFAGDTHSGAGFPRGVAILVIALIGGVVLAASFLGER